MPGWWQGGVYALSISTGVSASTAAASSGDYSRLSVVCAQFLAPCVTSGQSLHLSGPPPFVDLEKGPVRAGSCMPLSGPHPGAGTLPQAPRFKPPRLPCSGHDLAVRLAWRGLIARTNAPEVAQNLPTGLWNRSLSLSLSSLRSGKVDVKDGGGLTPGDPGDTLPCVPRAPPALQESPTRRVC